MSIETVLRSIVTVRSSIPDDAFTATTLGTLREGSGVVIREDGLVLTVGYLIIEAQEVWLTRHDGHVVPGHALAYDQETGFGLVQALGQLGTSAVDFGDAAEANVGDFVVLADGTGQFVRASIVAKQEFAGYWEYVLDEAIFIAPAHPSWGGAGLIGSDGKLLGIGSLRLQMSRNGEIADVNMVVPINLLPPILDDLVSHGRVNKPKFCRGLNLGNNQIQNCLQKNEAKVLPTCTSTLTSVTASIQQRQAAQIGFFKICAHGSAQYCKGMKGEGNILACLLKTKRIDNGKCNQAITDAGWR
jgi:S1-C subfamily serine protease